MTADGTTAQRYIKWLLTVQHLGDLRRDVDLGQLLPARGAVAAQLGRVMQRQPDGATAHRHVADWLRLRTDLECFFYLLGRMLSV